MAKYQALDQELQIDLCQKHIELWKHLLIEMEIPSRNEVIITATDSRRIVPEVSLPSVRNPVVVRNTPSVGSFRPVVARDKSKNGGSSVVESFRNP